MDGNCGKLKGSNLVISCYKEFERFELCKSVSPSKATFVVYSEPIERGHVKILHNGSTFRLNTKREQN